MRKKDWNQIVQESHENYAIKVTEVGSVKYVAIARVGTPQSDPYWQAKKVDTTTGVVITWADGDDEFDNIATDLTSLSYS